jgi:HEAT repeat protein
MQRLFAIDPGLLDGLADRAIRSPDAAVRRWGAASMVNEASRDRIEPLCSLLDDVNPGLRRQIAAAVVELARRDSELRQAVVSAASAILDQDAWRGCEQAAVVLANLDHDPAGKRLVDLLNHPRGEVMVASAWALRRLDRSEHLPAMLDRAGQVFNGLTSGSLAPYQPGYEDQVAQLFMAFGNQRYRPAEELMLRYLPKNPQLGAEARAAAVWAIGHLYRDDPSDTITSGLADRLDDVTSEPPEDERVRRMAAISLGRMGAEEAVATLRQYAGPRGSYVALACDWALERLTGESRPPMQPDVITIDDWFLEPLK